MTVKLTSSEIEHAEAKAKEHGGHQGFTTNFRGANDDGMDERGSRNMWRLGMLAEIAVAKFLGVEWSGDIGEDVGDLQVKSSFHQDGHLAVSTTTRMTHLHPRQIYVFGVPVDEMWTEFDIKGWARVCEFMRDEFLDDFGCPERPLQWKFPNDQLRPIDTLPTETAVDWVTPEGAKQKRRLNEERTTGYYQRVYDAKKRQRLIDLLTKTGQLTPEIEEALGLNPGTSPETRNSECSTSGNNSPSING